MEGRYLFSVFVGRNSRHFLVGNKSFRRSVEDTEFGGRNLVTHCWL